MKVKSEPVFPAGVGWVHWLEFLVSQCFKLYLSLYNNILAHCCVIVQLITIAINLWPQKSFHEMSRDPYYMTIIMLILYIVRGHYHKDGRNFMTDSCIVALI